MEINKCFHVKPILSQVCCHAVCLPGFEIKFKLVSKIVIPGKVFV